MHAAGRCFFSINPSRNIGITHGAPDEKRNAESDSPVKIRTGSIEGGRRCSDVMRPGELMLRSD